MDSPSDCPLATTLHSKSTVGVSTAIVHFIVTLLVLPAFLVLQVVQLFAALFIALLLYIRLILVLSSVPSDSLL
jgi:hypothetical protein